MKPTMQKQMDVPRRGHWDEHRLAEIRDFVELTPDQKMRLLLEALDFLRKTDEARSVAKLRKLV